MRSTFLTTVFACLLSVVIAEASTTRLLIYNATDNRSDDEGCKCAARRF